MAIYFRNDTCFKTLSIQWLYVYIGTHATKYFQTMLIWQRFNIPWAIIKWSCGLKYFGYGSIAKNQYNGSFVFLVLKNSTFKHGQRIGKTTQLLHH